MAGSIMAYSCNEFGMNSSCPQAQQYQERVAVAESRPLTSRLPTPDAEAQRRLAERSQQLLSKRQELARRRSSQAAEREARLARLQEQVCQWERGPPLQSIPWGRGALGLCPLATILA